MRAYYNDHDKNVCAWLEQLIRNGDITQGHVDDRSITEIKPDDIAGYDRVHFFAGIGTWDLALNRAGWGDRPIWTASLPCQPFSAAGKGRGKEDERHLLPAYLDLVKKCRPDVQIGEQVERAIGHGWLDDLQAVMEAEGYAVGHCVLGAHSVNAAHIRQRLYWVANAKSTGFETFATECRQQLQKKSSNAPSTLGRVGDTERARLERHAGHENSLCEQGRDDQESARSVAEASGYSGLANANGEQNNSANKGGLHTKSGGGCDESGIEWIFCRDGKYRPVKPGIKPLVDGPAGKLVCGSGTSAQIEANSTQEARSMRLKGYGNAIQAQTAEAFIRAFIDTRMRAGE